MAVLRALVDLFVAHELPAIDVCGRHHWFLAVTLVGVNSEKGVQQ